MSNPEDDVNTSPDDPQEGRGLGDMGADLQAALGDLLGADDASDGDEFDLSLLEDAVAELGMNLGGGDAAQAAAPQPDAPHAAAPTEAARPSARSHGLDLTELPPPAPSSPPAPAAAPPPAPAAATPPPPHQAPRESMFGGPSGAPTLGSETPARKLPPLGQASAEDLFGPLDDDDLGVDWGQGGDSVEAGDDLPPYEASPAPDPQDPIKLPAAQAPPPAATPTSDEVVAYAAHRGRLSGEIASKARKLFGR